MFDQVSKILYNTIRITQQIHIILQYIGCQKAVFVWD